MKEEKCVYIGSYKINQKPVLFNDFKDNANHNSPAIGSLGVGKQFDMKEVLIGQKQVVVFDPSGELEHVKYLPVDSNNQINPFDITQCKSRLN